MRKKHVGLLLSAALLAMLVGAIVVQMRYHPETEPAPTVFVAADGESTIELPTEPTPCAVDTVCAPPAVPVSAGAPVTRVMMSEPSVPVVPSPAPERSDIPAVGPFGGPTPPAPPAASSSSDEAAVIRGPGFTVSVPSPMPPAPPVVVLEPAQPVPPPEPSAPSAPACPIEHSNPVSVVAARPASEDAAELGIAGPPAPPAEAVQSVASPELTQPAPRPGGVQQVDLLAAAPAENVAAAVAPPAVAPEEMPMPQDMTPPVSAVPVSPTASPSTASHPSHLSLEGVANLAQQHVSEVVIVQEIRTTGSVYHLTPEQVSWLKANGVSDTVITEMQATGCRPVSQAVSPSDPPSGSPVPTPPVAVSTVPVTTSMTPTSAACNPPPESLASAGVTDAVTPTGGTYFNPPSAPAVPAPSPTPPLAVKPSAPLPLPQLTAVLPKPQPTPRSKEIVPVAGTYACQLAEHGELTLPKPVVEQMDKSQPRVLFVALAPDKKCLWLYTATGVERLNEQLQRAAGDEEKMRCTQRQCFSRLQRVQAKSDGVFLLPVGLVETACLKDNVILVGVRDHFEVWDAKQWEHYTNSDEAQ